MPRRSPYEISLSSTEERELRKRAAKYTLPYFQVVRAKMVLLAAQGLSNDEIVRLPGNPPRGRQLVEKALLRRTPRRSGGALSSGAASQISPQNWSFRLRP